MPRADNTWGHEVRYARFYFEGLVAHVHLGAEVHFEPLYLASCLGGGFENRTVVFWHRFEDSRTWDNIKEMATNVQRELRTPPVRRTSVAEAVRAISGERDWQVDAVPPAGLWFIAPADGCFAATDGGDTPVIVSTCVKSRCSWRCLLTGELERLQGDDCRVTGHALRALEAAREEDRRHTSNVLLQVVLALLAAATVFTGFVQANLVKLPAFWDARSKAEKAFEKPAASTFSDPAKLTRAASQ